MLSNRWLLAPLALSMMAGVVAADTDLIDPPIALCGMEPYRLLPANQVGRLLSFEKVPGMTMPAQLIDELIAGTEFETLSPVPYSVKIYRYRYTTQDKGKLVEATSILAVPTHKRQDKVLVFDQATPAATRGAGNTPLAARDPIVPKIPWALWLHGTSGFSDPCAPSADPGLIASVGLVASLGFTTSPPTISA